MNRLFILNHRKESKTPFRWLELQRLRQQNREQVYRKWMLNFPKLSITKHNYFLIGKYTLFIGTEMYFHWEARGMSLNPVEHYNLCSLLCSQAVFAISVALNGKSELSRAILVACRVFVCLPEAAFSRGFHIMACFTLGPHSDVPYTKLTTLLA